LDQGRWEEATCPICPSGIESVPFLTCSDRLREPQLRNYQLLRCTGCGLIYLSPRPVSSTAGEFYRDEGYDPFLSVHAPRGLLDRIYAILRRGTLKWKKRLIDRRTGARARILDIGCGTGEFLAILGKDYRVEGIEPAPEAARWARERLGLKVHTGSLDDVEFSRDRFDMITLWHVLEHLPEPSRELEKIHRLLADDGRLLIALPNIRSLDSRIYRSHWVALDAPRHLWHFSKPQLELLMHKSGFEITESGMLPLDTFYNSLYSEINLKQAGGNLQLILSPVRLTITTAASLVWGAVSGQHSGMYYILRKS